MQIVFICLNREYCNRVMVASQCELFLQCCGSLSSLIQFADHLQNICSLHSNVNSSEYPLFILLRLNPLSQRKLPIVISLSRMLCFGRVCASPCALNVSTALQGAYTLLLSWVSYSSFCSSFMLLSESPFLCKALVSSVFLQFTLVHNK